MPAKVLPKEDRSIDWQSFSEARGVPPPLERKGFDQQQQIPAVEKRPGADRWGAVLWLTGIIGTSA